MLGYVDDKIVKTIIKHIEEEYPREACGIIVQKQGLFEYIRCKNISMDPKNSFVIHPSDYVKAEEYGKISYIVHSHPDSSSDASYIDKLKCNQEDIPWVIIAYPSININTIYPESILIPYEGREFIFGIMDCFTLIKDYYKRELNININDRERSDNFWKRGQNLYVDNFEEEGFIEVNGTQNVQKNDIFLMTILSNNISNHAAIHIGDGIILHHLYGRLSGKDIYGGYWQKNTTHILRHKSLC